MRAVVVNHDVQGQLDIQDVPAPIPTITEALVRVAATSLNRGEVRGATRAQPGARIGWDFAGVIEEAAKDGSGPQKGARVVSFLRTGAWAELVAAPSINLATLPDNVTFAQAAALPVAGLSALWALERGGNLIGRNVLITGATGGVGLFACQLANLAGGRVVALVRRENQVARVRQVGAHEVIVSSDGSSADRHAPYDVVVESVGGRVLGNVMGMLSFGGVCVSLGASESSDATFDVRKLFGAGGSLYGFLIFNEVRRESTALGLARLLRLVAEGRLDPSIAVEAPWTDAGKIAQQLMDREFAGKAVLQIRIK
jgi:NADPH:quinone reductase